MFALADQNNCYVSCERIFQPELRNVPVVVLSNNDGNIISRSDEAKALGILMGDAYHLIEKKLNELGVRIRSSNYTLYDNISKRVIAVYKRFVPNIEVYSIDESFLDLSGIAVDDLVPLGRRIKQAVSDWVQIPVCVGIAPTKTLAKIANKHAKKNKESGGVVGLFTAEEQEALLAKTSLEDVWGIGRRLTLRLNQLGFKTALDLRNADPSFIRANFNVVVERVCRELKGESCLPLEMVVPDNKSLMCSRSFGVYLKDDFEKVKQATHAHVSRGAEKMRRQKLLTNRITVTLELNKFDEKYKGNWCASQSIELNTPTSDCRKLARFATWALKQIWQPGLPYKKVGVLFERLHSDGTGQLSMFAEPDSERSKRLMTAMDELNTLMGRDKVRLASSGTPKERAQWEMRRNFMSRRYTSQWTELVQVRAD